MATSLPCTEREERVGDLCCSRCPPGFGVTQTCKNRTNTVCSPCVHGKTFNPIHSHLDNCRRCSTCSPNSGMRVPCNATHDTLCQCNRGYYWDPKLAECKQCSLCPHGWGASKPCTPDHNARCHKCPEGTYSGVLSATQTCIKCTPCRAHERMLQECTAIQDTVCTGKTNIKIHVRRAAGRGFS